MPLAASTMMELGSSVPSFALPDVSSGKMVGMPDPSVLGPVLVMFICRHCPFVIHVQGELAKLGKDYAGKVNVIAISSNDASRVKDDSPESLREMAQAQGFVFPLCYDETQDVAMRFGAACTPEFFLFDRDRKLAYRGQLDGSRPGNNVAVDGRDLRAAIDSVLQGQRPSSEQRPSTGCSIKWKAGNEPVYFQSTLVNKK